MWAITSRRKRTSRLLNRIQFKFAMTYVALIVGLLLLLNIYPVLVSRDLVYDAKYASLTGQITEMSRALAGGESLEGEMVQQAMADFDIDALDRVVVTDQAGITIYDSCEQGVVGERILLDDLAMGLVRENLLEGLAMVLSMPVTGAGYNAFLPAYIDGSFHSWASRPIRGNEAVIIGVLYLYENDPGQGAMILDMQRNLQNISLIIFVVALFLALFFSQTLTARLREILSAIRVVGRGDYSYKVPVRGSDELAELGQSFNQLTDRLQETEELRRRFVSDASHELKTPLASIQLLSDSIVQSEDMELSTIREFVVDIGQEAERLARTTERLLRLTRLDVAPVTQLILVDVGQVVRSAGHMLRHVAEEWRVEMVLDLEENCHILATEDDIYQVILNLAENGIKYNVEGGTLTLRLEKKEGQVRLTAEDTGIGIPKEDLPYIFDRFYRVDKARSRERGGSGLGLSIVRDTVRQHGGSVEAHSQPGGGSRFVVVFPAWEEEAAEES